MACDVLEGDGVSIGLGGKPQEGATSSAQRQSSGIPRKGLLAWVLQDEVGIDQMHRMAEAKHAEEP